MKHNILIVEDDELNRMVYKLILRPGNYELDFAVNGREGVDKYVSKRYDIVLLDMGLPILMGDEVARLMRLHDAVNPQGKLVPIIAVSADNTRETKDKAMDAGVNLYCRKPVESQELIGIINSYLNKSIDA